MTFAINRADLTSQDYGKAEAVACEATEATAKWLDPAVSLTLAMLDQPITI